MSEINQSFVDRVRYRMSHDLLGTVVINEPVGWRDDDKELVRNKDYFGIFPKFSNSSVYVGRAAEFITTAKDLDGIQCRIRLSKDARHPKTDIWENVYTGFLDMSTWTKETKGISLKFNSEGIEQALKTREGEEVELDRLTTMDGEVIEPMPYQTVEYLGRRIFLKSVLENMKAPDNYAAVSIFSNGNTRSDSCALPMRIVSRSHEELSNVPNQATGSVDNGSTNMMFFFLNQIQRNVKISITLRFKTNVTRFDDVNGGYFYVGITTFKDGTAYNIRERVALLQVDLDNARTQLGGTVSYLGGNWATNNPPVSHYRSVEIERTLFVGDSVAIESLVHASLGDNFSRGHCDIRCEDIIIDKLVIEEESIFQKTFAKFYLPFEIFERLIRIYTGKKNGLSSKVLGRIDIGYPVDGSASLLGLNHGFWVRGFDAGVSSNQTDLNLFKPLNTSLRDCIDSYSTTANIGMGIEQTGYSEKVVIEDKKYFFNRNVTIKLPNQVKKVKRAIALDYVYSGIEIGYDKGGVYDEAQGLDEYNGKNNYSTIITKTKNIFSKISPFRADSYGKEFCRRKPYEVFPSTDTQYDADKFINDLKRGPNNVFQERVWQDDFAQAPTGIYSPETATNLRISPFNLLLRHGWEIGAGLTKNPTDKIQYNKSTGNSGMRTKKIGGAEYAENSYITNGELERARYEAELVEFEHQVDFEINKLLSSYTVINGEKIYNLYGLIEFINEDNELERGWLLSLKPNKEGKWQLLKFNK